jgi:Kef-type K+ transport system membrane component KefB
MNVSAGPVAPMSGHQVLIFLLLMSLLFGVALALGLLARRLGLPSVIGELCAGVLVGPSVVGHLSPHLTSWLRIDQAGQLHLVDAVAQLGVLLLVGVTGIGVDVGLLRRRAGMTVWVSTTSLVLPLVSGVALGFLLPAALVAPGGDRITFAAFVGVALCVSAVPVIAKTLLDLRLLHRDIGQLIIGSATFSDLVGWLLLSIVSAMATVGVRATSVLLPVLYLVGTFVACLTIARFVVCRVVRMAGRHRDRSVLVAAVVLLLSLFAVGTQALGLEAVLGAMLGGVVIGSVRGLDRDALKPLRSFVMAVLAPLFFATAGLRMDLTVLVRPEILFATALALLVAITTKFAGAYFGARTARLSRWEAMALGAGLNARGAIEVIIAMVGLQLGVLTTEMYTVIVLVAIVTSLIAPPMLRMAARHIEVTPEEEERARWTQDDLPDDEGPARPLRAA